MLSELRDRISSDLNLSVLDSAGTSIPIQDYFLSVDSQRGLRWAERMNVPVVARGCVCIFVCLFVCFLSIFGALGSCVLAFVGCGASVVSSLPCPLMVLVAFWHLGFLIFMYSVVSVFLDSPYVFSSC